MTAATIRPSHAPARWIGGESDDQPFVGLVTDKSRAGGTGATDSPCPYCGESGGHTAQCPVVS